MLATRWAQAAAPLPAEALHRVAEPLAVVLRNGGPASAAAVARHLALLVQPPEASTEVPAWLRPEQVPICRRLLHVVAAHGGALLAEPVGCGKTYVALAAARLLNGAKTTSVLAPAPLVTHWERTARELDVPIDIRSHAAASRGRVPAGAGLILIDESHHYRNPATRRYTVVARWVVGRPVLLLSATPAINRLSDVAAQLLLGIRDDALAAWGTPSLRHALNGIDAPPSIGELIVARARDERTTSRLALAAPDDAERLAHLIDRLALAPEPAVAALIRRVLLAAAASSPAALAEAALRYERLLLNARDAALAGRPLSRDTLRKFVAAEGDQLWFWELLPPAEGTPLAIDDLDAVRGLRRHAETLAQRDDGRCGALRQLLSDATPTLVFCTRRATVRWLTSRLGNQRLAWCTGERAGIGPLVLPRAAVLDQFRGASAQASSSRWVPQHLVTTDIAAEGLDLRRLVRVVHYDQPWTDARMVQREGRTASPAARSRPQIIPAPPSLEARLGRSAILHRKAGLSHALGLKGDSQWWWTWREALARTLDPGSSEAGCAVVQAERPGILAGLVITTWCRGVPSTRANVLVWVDQHSTEDDPQVLVPLLRRLGSLPSRPASRAEWSRASTILARVARERLALCQRAMLTQADAMSLRAPLLDRMHRLIRTAARHRDRDALRRLEYGLRVVGRGHTSGESLLLRELLQADDNALLRALVRLPAPERGGVPWVGVSGVLIAQGP